jgi:hypothetical protein
MWCDATQGEVEKRDLTSDDAAGICNIYGPDAIFVDEGKQSLDSRSGGSGGCHVAPESRRSAWGLAWLAFAVGAACWRRRRTR